ncbi:MAG TPA: type II toxin-antitoxin system prevent-host-death family antitoxin [Phycisphaerae bacterium]|nr:type II toxin-antitoxin system prevent-host-death family antitoxin [Phycisphaerae bacterium]
MIEHESTVGAYDAKTNFSKLLERVEGGEEITITRHGLPVARMVPVHQKKTREERRKAIEAIRKLAQGNSLGGLRIKDLIAEGRP